MHMAEVMIPVWRTSSVLMEMLIPGGTDARSLDLFLLDLMSALRPTDDLMIPKAVARER
jgi:hypothetical protein